MRVPSRARRRRPGPLCRGGFPAPGSPGSAEPPCLPCLPFPGLPVSPLSPVTPLGVTPRVTSLPRRCRIPLPARGSSLSVQGEPPNFQQGVEPIAPHMVQSCFSPVSPSCAGWQSPAQPGLVVSAAPLPPAPRHRRSAPRRGKGGVLWVRHGFLRERAGKTPNQHPHY